MTVSRGHSFAACNAAITAAVIADAEAWQEREDARQERSEEAFVAMLRRPESIKWVEPSRERPKA
jgi:hypothetical protein